MAAYKIYTLIKGRNQGKSLKSCNRQLQPIKVLKVLFFHNPYHRKYNHENE